MTDPTPFLAAAGLTVQRPDGTLERVEFADGASWSAADSATIRELMAAGDAADELADTHRVIDRLSDAERASVAAHSAAAGRAAADDTATSAENQLLFAEVERLRRVSSANQRITGSHDA